MIVKEIERLNSSTEHFGESKGKEILPARVLLLTFFCALIGIACAKPSLRASAAGNLLGV